MKLSYLSCYHQMKLHKNILLESINLNICCEWFTFSLPFIKTSVTFVAAKVGTAYYCKMRWVESFMHSCAPTHPYPCQFCPVHPPPRASRFSKCNFWHFYPCTQTVGRPSFGWMIIRVFFRCPHARHSGVAGLKKIGGLPRHCPLFGQKPL